MFLFLIPVSTNELMDPSPGDWELLNHRETADIQCLLVEEHNTPRNVIKAPDGAINSQVAQRTEEHIKLHHRDAVDKVQTGGNSVGQMTWISYIDDFQGEREREREKEGERESL